MKDTFTAIPTVKGGITLPAKIRKKYKIGKETPLQIFDEGNGIIKIKVMQMSEYGDVIFSETGKAVRLTFPKGLDPEVLIKKIDEIKDACKNI